MSLALNKVHTSQPKAEDMDSSPWTHPPHPQDNPTSSIVDRVAPAIVTPTKSTVVSDASPAKSSSAGLTRSAAGTRVQREDGDDHMDGSTNASVAPATATPLTPTSLTTGHQGDDLIVAKPNEASAGTCHECGTALPISSLHLAAADSIPARMLLLWSQFIVKDDVFFGQAQEFSVQHPKTGPDLCPTPCLSPVTSPSDFLCDHEPLFDGIEDIHEDNQHGEPAIVQPLRKIPVSTLSDGVDWIKLLDEFHRDDAVDIPTPSTTSEIEESGDEADTEDTVGNRLSLKRKRPRLVGDTMRQHMYRLTLSDSEDNDDIDKGYDGITSDTDSHAFRSINMLPSHKRRRRRPSALMSVDNHQTVFERLTATGVNWCRYCGTTEGVNWRPGPWGKRTLCNKHGCDYKGYGLANRLPRLDLSAYADETLQDRRRPIVQQFCVICQLPQLSLEDKLIPCEGGCSRAYHQRCHSPVLYPLKEKRWCCSTACRENRSRNKVVVDLPRRHLPLMRVSSKKSSPSPDFY